MIVKEKEIKENERFPGTISTLYFKLIENILIDNNCLPAGLTL